MLRPCIHYASNHFSFHVRTLQADVDTVAGLKRKRDGSDVKELLDPNSTVDTNTVDLDDDVSEILKITSIQFVYIIFGAYIEIVLSYF